MVWDPAEPKRVELPVYFTGALRTVRGIPVRAQRAPIAPDDGRALGIVQDWSEDTRDYLWSLTPQEYASCSGALKRMVVFLQHGLSVHARSAIQAMNEAVVAGDDFQPYTVPADSPWAPLLRGVLTGSSVPQAFLLAFGTPQARVSLEPPFPFQVDATPANLVEGVRLLEGKLQAWHLAELAIERGAQRATIASELKEARVQALALVAALSRLTDPLRTYSVWEKVLADAAPHHNTSPMEADLLGDAIGLDDGQPGANMDVDVDNHSDRDAEEAAAIVAGPPPDSQSTAPSTPGPPPLSGKAKLMEQSIRALLGAIRANNLAQVLVSPTSMLSARPHPDRSVTARTSWPSRSIHCHWT